MPLASRYSNTGVELVYSMPLVLMVIHEATTLTFFAQIFKYAMTFNLEIMLSPMWNQLDFSNGTFLLSISQNLQRA